MNESWLLEHLNPMNVSPKNSNSRSAFSLVEMLTVVVVISLVVAIAIPSLSNLNETAGRDKARRNAQTLASVFGAAQAAGLDFFVPGDEAATIQAVVDGGIVLQEGPFKDLYFGVPNISPADQVQAATYLEMNDAHAMLNYIAP